MASASRPILMEVHMKANIQMEILMDKGPTLGQIELTTRVRSLIIKGKASENKHSKTAFTGATIKTTGPMELESRSTLMGIHTRDNGKMDCFTASAQCTLILKGRQSSILSRINRQDTRYSIKRTKLLGACNIRGNSMAFKS
jgi:hypothetical protein